jgi:surface antigen
MGPPNSIQLGFIAGLSSSPPTTICFSEGVRVMRKFLMATAALTLFVAAPALAQGWNPPPNADPDGYYSRSDQQGYYGRDGRYHRFDENNGWNNGPNDNGWNNGPGAYDNGPPPQVYEEGQYEERCRDNGNKVAGTLFGALAGGLIGGAASHGNGGAVVGGAILGGLLGNAVSRDIPCEDHPYAFRAYATGLNGDLGHRYEWRHGSNWGYFTPQREFYRGRQVCRTWSETTYARGRNYTRSGTACRMTDGNWHFDD